MHLAVGDRDYRELRNAAMGGDDGDAFAVGVPEDRARGFELEILAIEQHWRFVRMRL
jgi:hypothetical protein